MSVRKRPSHPRNAAVHEKLTVPVATWKALPCPIFQAAEGAGRAQPAPVEGVADSTPLASLPQQSIAATLLPQSTMSLYNLDDGGAPGLMFIVSHVGQLTSSDACAPPGHPLLIFSQGSIACLEARVSCEQVAAYVLQAVPVQTYCIPLWYTTVHPVALLASGRVAPRVRPCIEDADEISHVLTLQW